MKTEKEGNDLTKVENLSKEIRFDNPELLFQYGSEVQKKLSTFSETILKDVTNKQVSEIGSLLTDMMLTVKGINIENIANPGLIARVWNKLLTEVSLYKSGFEKVVNQLDVMRARLEDHKLQLTEDIKMLDQTYEHNLGYYNELDLLIQAGEKSIETKKAELEELQVSVVESDDYLQIQKVKDQRSFLQQFEKRIHDLKLTKTMTLQTLPQIRLIQHNNNELVNKIQSSILNTIPIWKNQIILAMSLQKQKKITEVQKKIHKTTNDLLIQNSEALKENSIDVARLSEQGILEVSTLKKVNQDLISTISGALQIYHEGSEKRKQVEAELVEIERQLKSSLSEAKKIES